MTLYIHFGIYKAGSSYIQYICANQREYLLSKGILFPQSEEDNKMKAGLISKGNADNLNDFLKAKNSNSLKKTLEHWFNEAKNAKANAVLISAEALVHQLAIEEKIKILSFEAHKVGFTNIKAMGFFRDLADHALSTYKHRAKTGKHPDYEYWIKHNYETPQLINNLAQTIRKSQSTIQWTLRKFQKDSEFLKQAFFKDWLEIDIPDFKTKPNVNESLTLSEVKIMNHLKKAYPLGIDFFVDDLKKLPKSGKAKEKDLEQFIIHKFTKALQPHEETLYKINIFLYKEERLLVSEGLQFKETSIEPNIQLTEEQLQIISNRMYFFNSFAGLKILYRRRLKNLFPKKLFSIY